MTCLDFTITRDGPVDRLRPITDAAKEWADINVADTAKSGNVIVIDHRNANRLLVQIERSRLTVAYK